MSVSITAMENLIREVTDRLDRLKMFEYRTENQPSLRDLQALGKEGWELCCSDNVGDVYLKREMGSR